MLLSDASLRFHQLLDDDAKEVVAPLDAPDAMMSLGWHGIEEAPDGV